VHARDARIGKPIFDGRGVAARPKLPALGSDRLDAFARWKDHPMNHRCHVHPYDQHPTVRLRRNQERTVMNPSLINPVYNVATLRQAEYQAEAERRRLLREARTARTGKVTGGVVAALRRTVGVALVRTGERLQGAERAAARPAAGDLNVAGTKLRIVR
jgi:hypothetical protein